MKLQMQKSPRVHPADLRSLEIVQFSSPSQIREHPIQPSMSLLSQVRGFIFLFCKSPRPSSIKPFTACLYKPFRRYGQESRLRDDGHHEMGARAPSIAEVFERVAEEKQKLQAAEQGVASQTSDKLHDGAEEATIGESKVEPVKKRFEEHEEGADYRRTGDED